MTMDDLLCEIARRSEGEELLLPLRRLSGKSRKYVRLGVFKRSARFRSEIPCPNGCGVLARVLKRGDGDYVVCCDHGDRQMEDIAVPREDVELYALDWVTFGECVRHGSIAYRRPSAAGECKTDPVAAKAFLQETARNIAENVGVRKPSRIAAYILRDAKDGETFVAECEEIRDLKRIHRWQSNSFDTYVRQAFAGRSQTETARRKSKVEANRKMLSKELSKL